MKIQGTCFLATILLGWVGVPFHASAEDWLQWRGPRGNGTTGKEVQPPLEWTETKNVRWKTFVPGRGLSSPIVVKDLVIVTTAANDGQFVLAYSLADGSIRWKERIHSGGLPEKLHRKNSAATSTPASDGRRLYVVFHQSGQVMLSAMTLEGELVWQKDAGPFECDYGFGYAPSPTLYGDSIILSSEFTAGGFLASFRTIDGGEIWRTERRVKTSYSSPVVARVGNRDQLLLSGADKVSSFDPGSGKVLWAVEGSSLATCGTMVWSADTVFASGGFPNKETIAVQADGEPRVLWRNGDKSYEQSMLYHEGHLYAFNDGGIAVCWNAQTGEEKWKVRLGGPVSASPILAGGRIYAMNEQGTTHVFLPDPDDFTKLAENQLGAEGFSTPAFVGNRVFIRTADASEERREWLYCLGDSD